MKSEDVLEKYEEEKNDDEMHADTSKYSEGNFNIILLCLLSSKSLYIVH